MTADCMFTDISKTCEGPRPGRPPFSLWKVKGISLHHKTQTDSGAHHASYTVGTVVKQLIMTPLLTFN